MSTKLTPQDVVKIAKLARISDNPSEEFINKYTKELGAILDMADDLQKLDTTGISPFDGVRTIKVEDLREDEITSKPEEYSRIRQNIINNFPNKKGDLLVLPGIFE